MRRTEGEARRVFRGDQRGEYTGVLVDLAERAERADRGIIGVGVEAADMHRKNVAVLCIRNQERTGCRGRLDHVVQSGVADRASRNSLNRREGHRLLGRAGILDIDDRTIGVAGEDQIAVGGKLERIRISLRDQLRLAGHGIVSHRAVEQHGSRGKQLARFRVRPVQQLDDGRIAISGRIRVAQEHVLALEHDIVIAARGRGLA